MTNKIVYSVMYETSAEAIHDLIRVLFPDAKTAIDMTYGKGNFWGTKPDLVQVTSVDLNPECKADVVADFTDLPFGDGSFDIAIFDPPYQWDVSKKNPSVMGKRYGSYESEEHAINSIQLGSREAWRVSRLGCIIKVQNHIHGAKFVHMTRWVQRAIRQPLYDELHVVRNKLIDPSWGEQLSVYRNHSTFMVFRHDGPIHKKRGIV